MEWIILIIIVAVIWAAFSSKSHKPVKPKRMKGHGVDNDYFTVTATIERPHNDWERRQRESFDSALDAILPETGLDDYAKKILTEGIRDRGGYDGNLIKKLQVAHGMKDFRWPWLEQCKRQFDDAGVTLQGYQWLAYVGPPAVATSFAELEPHLKVAEMRAFLKKHDLYPSPAPRKREEFEELMRDVPWSMLVPLAERVFEKTKDDQWQRFLDSKFTLLYQAIQSRARSEREFKSGRSSGSTWTVRIDDNVIAARAALEFANRQAPPLPPFYPGDGSYLMECDRSIRTEANERIAAAALRPGEPEELYHERIYKAHWMNAEDFEAEGDWAMTRQSYQKAGMALAGLPGRENEKRRLVEDTANALRRDPAYVVALHELKQIIRAEPGILQTEIYDRVPFPKEEVGQVLYFADQMAEIRREKSGRTYALSVADQQDKLGE